MAAPEQATPTGVIHDIGYQRYSGPRLGRGYATRSLYEHGLRSSFGLGRSAKAKIFPWLVVGIAGLVAAVLVAIRAQTGAVPLTYDQFPQQLSLLTIFFCAIVAPELVSRDLKSGVLPLYFSRPISRTDYALAKLGALGSAVFLLLAGPLLLMFIGAAFTLKGGPGKIWDEFVDFLGGAAYCAIYAILFSAIAILVASLIGRRAVAAGAVVAVFLLTTPVVGVLSVLPSETSRQLAGLASPLTLVGGVGDWLFGQGAAGEDNFGIGTYGPLYGLVTVLLAAACVLGLLARYRKVAR
ncbi:ABC transporter permease [Rhizomonospora bruguierae]|uniref:ABC transporter permease n=1 Tax=Rhizomonospora bruguierae TaxID=1581705 RepID=UPI001BCBF603|nr:ABC transporter permease [Micromonospora sp. NBRC 107566]